MSLYFPLSAASDNSQLIFWNNFVIRYFVHAFRIYFFIFIYRCNVLISLYFFLFICLFFSSMFSHTYVLSLSLSFSFKVYEIPASCIFPERLAFFKLRVASHSRSLKTLRAYRLQLAFAIKINPARASPDKSALVYLRPPLPNARRRSSRFREAPDAATRRAGVCGARSSAATPRRE